MKTIALSLGLAEDATEEQIAKAVTKLLKSAEKDAGTIGKLEEQVATLKGELAAARKSGPVAPEGVDEKEIAEKCRHGLTREQSIAVIVSQQQEDAAEARRRKAQK